PTICVEIFAATVGANERTNPGPTPAILFDAFQTVRAMGTGKGPAVQLRVGVDIRCSRGTRDGTNRTVRSRQVALAPVEVEQRACRAAACRIWPDFAAFRPKVRF